MAHARGTLVCNFFADWRGASKGEVYGIFQVRNPETGTATGELALCRFADATEIVVGESCWYEFPAHLELLLPYPL